MDCQSSNPNEQNYELMNISPSGIGDARYFTSEIISREYFSGSPYVVDFHLILTISDDSRAIASFRIKQNPTER